MFRFGIRVSVSTRVGWLNLGVVADWVFKVKEEGLLVDKVSLPNYLP